MLRKFLRADSVQGSPHQTLTESGFNMSMNARTFALNKRREL